MPTAQTGQDRILYYVHDPMCSWCWAFRPVWSALTRDLPAGIRPQRLLGGLAPDTREPMPQQMRDKISAIWQQIQQMLPATEFNHDFWQRCTPRRSTYPACRAVISARNQGAGFEEPMILAIQRAYYLEARNPSEEETLAELAEAIGLDGDEFVRDLNAAADAYEAIAVSFGEPEEDAFDADLSARAFHRILRLARTLADLDASARIEDRHLTEAISYRRLDRITSPG